jgi:outer membrane protein assembly factor BamB
VRFTAASGLVQAADKEAVVPLMTLLTAAPPDLAGQVEDLLFQLAGDKAPSTAFGDDAEARRKCRATWETWWKTHADTVDWKRLRLEGPLLGLTLVCEAHLPDGGRVFECAADGKPRWTVKVHNPIDGEVLPGNRVLVADCNTGQVIELDRQGKQLWRYACSSPLAVQRLPNGNTFIGTYSEVLEVTREGKKLYGYPRNQGGSLYYARKLRNGHIVCVHSNGVLTELDAGGREVLALNVGGMSNWAGVEILPSGRFLVVKSGDGEVVEVDRTGKVMWRVAVNNPNSAVRLRNGHTLVASHNDNCVYEFDRSGKEVWKRKVEGHPFRARRR